VIGGELSEASTSPRQKTFSEYCLGLFANVAPGEGRALFCLFFSLFSILMTTYILKPVRELLILTEGDSEIRSYAVALQAIVLLVLIPIYGRLSQKLDKLTMMRVVVLFFAFNMIVFSLVSQAGGKIAIVFFIWMGTFGVFLGAQFWAFVSDLYNKAAGERLFAIIALGASSGAWCGSAFAAVLTSFMPAHELILLGAATLLMSILPIAYAMNSIPESSRVVDEPEDETEPDSHKSLFNGFKVVHRSRYLIAIALFVIVYNWLNSTSEFMLASIVERVYDSGDHIFEQGLSKEAFVGRFYSTFYFAVNILGFLIQAFLVSRIIKFFGMRIAILITPLIALVSYSVLMIAPVLAIFRVVKITENSLDYSLVNTTRQILYLPLSKEEKYEGRAVIDTFCIRIGDLVQAFAIFFGIHYLHLAVKQFVFLNFFLAAILLALTIYIGREYSRNSEAEAETSS
jgi:AAA family ATP:ADP antiporter